MSSISAWPTPWAMPPWTWPFESSGLITVPTSSTTRIAQRSSTVAGVVVDLDLADMAAIGEVSRVGGRKCRVVEQARLDARRQAARNEASLRDLLDRSSRGRCRRRRRRRRRNSTSASRRFEQMGGDLLALGDDLVRRRRSRPSRRARPSASRRCRCPKATLSVSPCDADDRSGSRPSWSREDLLVDRSRGPGPA